MRKEIVFVKVILALLFMFSSLVSAQVQHNSSGHQLFPRSNASQNDFCMNTFRYNSEPGISMNALRLSDMKHPVYETDYYVVQLILAELGGALGVAAGLAIDGNQFVNNRDTDVGGLFLTVFAGYALGIAGGVHVTGVIAKKDRSFLWALGGSVLGTGIAMVALETSDSNLGVVLTYVLPPAFSILSYNLGPVKSDKNVSIGQVGYFQDSCGKPGVKMDLLSYRF